MISLRRIVLQLRNNDILSDSDQVHMHADVVRPRRVNIDNRRLIEAQLRGVMLEIGL